MLLAMLCGIDTTIKVIDDSSDQLYADTQSEVAFDFPKEVQDSSSLIKPNKPFLPQNDVPRWSQRRVADAKKLEYNDHQSWSCLFYCSNLVESYHLRYQISLVYKNFICFFTGQKISFPYLRGPPCNA